MKFVSRRIFIYVRFDVRIFLRVRYNWVFKRLNDWDTVIVFYFFFFLCFGGVVVDDLDVTIVFRFSFFVCFFLVIFLLIIEVKGRRRRFFVDFVFMYRWWSFLLFVCWFFLFFVWRWFDFRLSSEILFIDLFFFRWFFCEIKYSFY